MMTGNMLIVASDDLYTGLTCFRCSDLSSSELPPLKVLLVLVFFITKIDCSSNLFIINLFYESLWFYLYIQRTIVTELSSHSRNDEYVNFILYK